MNKLKFLILDLSSVALSGLLTLILWRLNVADPVPSIVAGLLLELVLVTHRVQTRVSRFSRLLGEISSVPELAEIVSSVNELSSDRRRFTQLILKTMSKNTLYQISQLKRGRLTMSPDQFMALARTIYENLGPSDTLVATSYFAGGDYWVSKFGAEYANLNRQASLRGARIKRIYMLRDKIQLTEKDTIMKTQTKYSEIRCLVLDEVPLGDAEQRDFFVVNEDLVAEFHFAGGHLLSSIDIVLDQDTVREMSALMKKLERNSKPLDA